MLLNCTNKCFLDLKPCQGRCCLTTLDYVEGQYCICRKTTCTEHHVYTKPCAPLGAWPMHLYGMCMWLCLENYRPVATWSDCSIFLQSMHTYSTVHRCTETSQHNIEGRIILLLMCVQTRTRTQTWIGIWKETQLYKPLPNNDQPRFSCDMSSKNVYSLWCCASTQ